MLVQLHPREFRDARRAAGLTQQEVAALIGITVGTVSRFERGLNRPHRLIAARMAEVVGLPQLGFDGEAPAAAAPPPIGGAEPDEAAA